MAPVGATVLGDDLSLPIELTLSHAVGSRPWTDVADLVVGPRDLGGPDRREVRSPSRAGTGWV